MMFSEFLGHPGHGPPHHVPHPHMPPPSHCPPHGHHPNTHGLHPHPFYGRPRMDPTSDVFTCLFGDLFVKCFEDSSNNSLESVANLYQPMDLQADSTAQKTRKNKEDKYCGVCGDRALGYNFDAISCESCKAFFRRNAPKSLDYFKCPYEEKCKMDVSNRRFCKRCRLRKCFEIGMRKEYILTDEEKTRKRMRIEENRLKECDKHQKQLSPGVVDSTTSVTQARLLEPEEEYLIDEVVTAYHQSLEIKVENELTRENPDFQALVNIAEVSIRRVIDMSKKIKSFKALSQSDQIGLLKGGSIELLILRSVIGFDRDKNAFHDALDGEKSAMTMEQFSMGIKGASGLFDDHMKFVQGLTVEMKADETVLILLLIISLFSPDRPNIQDKHYVACEQEKYAMLLQRYMESKHPSQVVKQIYPKLLMKLTDIRNLNEGHSQVLLKVNPNGLQPLMKEVLDMNVTKAELGE